MPGSRDHLATPDDIPLNTQVSRELAKLRTAAGLTREDAEARLLLGAGWIGGVEEARVPLDLNILAAIVEELGTNLSSFFRSVRGAGYTTDFARLLAAEQDGPDLAVLFPNGADTATYPLRDRP